MAGSGITATNGVLSAASASLKIVDIVPSNNLSSGKIVENGQKWGLYTPLSLLWSGSTFYQWRNPKARRKFWSRRLLHKL